MNPLLTALESAADKYGAPVIGTRPGRVGFFVALLFGDDHAFVPSGDNYTVYEFDGRSTATGVYTWRDLGTRDNVLDAMAAHAEAYLAGRDAVPYDEHSAEWLGALLAGRMLAQHIAHQRTAVLRAERTLCVREIIADVERAAANGTLGDRDDAPF